jgi:cytochrome P450 family 110
MLTSCLNRYNVRENVNDIKLNMTSAPQLKKSSLHQRLQWIADPVKYMETAAKEFPDIFTADIIDGDRSYIFVHHPTAIEQILTNDIFSPREVSRQKFNAAGRENAILKPLLGNASIVMLESDRHKNRRKLLLPPFHGKRMQVYGELICQLTTKIFDRLTPGEVFTARTLTQEISLQVILEAVYGLEDSDRHRELKQNITQMADVFRSPLTSAFLFFPWLQKDLGAWSPWGNFVRQQNAIDRAIYREINQRQTEKDSQSQDILSLMMSAHDEAGQPMSDGELRDELMTLMFAGHETTATAMAWALYWIHHQPEVKQKLLAEIDSLGSNPEHMAIAKLPYLDAVCKETLRIYPVGMLTFGRVVEEPTELLGYQLKPQEVVVGCIYLMHQREDIYPQAQQFQPERFLTRQFSPYEFFPFGGGARRCVGEALAMLEMKLAIATILTRYQLQLTSSRSELPQRRGVTLAPQTGVKMTFCGRRTVESSQQLTGIGGSN